jgi:polyisoprenoid-binding protein YceI
MKRTRVATSLLLPLLALAAQGACARDWQVDAAKSTLSFKGTYENGPIEGRFDKFSATIAFDEADLSKDRFDVTINIASVHTESEERDDTLRTPDFFDTPRFPTAHFVTESFGKGRDGGLEARGSLTIRDNNRPVVLKVRFAGSGDAATLDVDTVLNRQDFGLGVGADWADIGNEVPVHGHLVLSAK